MTARVLITGARAPVALHLARLFHAAGHYVVLADSLANTMSSVSACCDAYVVLPPPVDDLKTYATAVNTAVAQHQISHVFPTCEEVFYLAQAWQAKDINAHLFAPDPDLLAQVHNKFTFAEMARGMGLNVPETLLLQNTDDVTALRTRSRDLVFKPSWSRFATHVLIQPRADALNIEPSPKYPWVAQAFVAGRELCAYAFCHAGRVGAVSVYHPRYRAGRGSGVYFDRVENAQITSFIAEFAQATAWTGQIAFDFIESVDGTVWAIECNPRAVSGLHFFREPLSFCAAFLGGGDVIAPDVSAPQMVRSAMWIFGGPQAVRSRSIGAFLRDLKRGQEVLHWPGDPRPARHQLRAIAEIAQIAVARRCSLQAASTFDIEWNGPD